MKVTVKRRFRVNGVEYDGVEAMPPEIRQAYEKAAALSGRSDLQGGIQARITFNAKTYGSREEMPPEERLVYDAAMAALEKDPDAVTTADAARASAESVSSAAIGPRSGKGSALKFALVVGGLVVLVWIVLAILKGMR